MSGSTQNDADAEGDLVLLVGSDEIPIRVTSKVLSLASPVFAAMLGPSFAEGQALTDKDPRGRTVSLPNDDAEALTWLCQALHFKKKFSAIVSISLMKELAILSDKYDMSIALSTWSELWLQKFEGSIEGSDAFPEVLWISYAFHNHQAFWKASRELIFQYTAEALVMAGGLLTNRILPDRVFDSIIAEREDALLELQMTIEDIITPQTKAVCPRQQEHDRSNTVCEYIVRTGHYLKQLSLLGLWPISKVMPHMSVSTISSRLLHFKNHAVDDMECTFTGGMKIRQGDFMITTTDCRSVRTDLKSLLQNAANAASIQQQGLCIKCIRGGKVTKKDGNCRAATETLHDKNCEDLNDPIESLESLFQ